MPASPLKCAYFAAIVLVALTLGPSLAHLLELPNKIGLDRAAYFTVQQVYRGWALLGILIFLALASTLTLTIMLRRERRPMLLSAVSFIALAAGQAVFWAFTFPANQATSNWTVAPPDWEQLRSRWEYSHAAGALLNTLALAAIVLSVLAWAGPRRAAGRSAGAPRDV
ncbi:MAG TPA: hypothetical protein VFF69_01145 [Phycisphaerales bacterium]|nr:hypothetical protein [Phycisphaerales bacterium]